MRYVTIGTFDLFHTGHKRLLDFLTDRTWGDDRALLAINADDSPALNGKQLVNDQDTRLAIAGSYFCHEKGWLWDDVVYNHGRGHELLEDGDLVVVGSEYIGRYPEQLGTTQAELDARGISVLYRPRTPGISSTQIRASIVLPTDPVGIAEGPYLGCTATLNEIPCERPAGHDGDHEAGPMAWRA